MRFKVLTALLAACLVAVTVVACRGPADLCSEPVTYRIGVVDERFGLERWEFALAVRRAAAVWEEPLGRTFFTEHPQGMLEINLLYDYRQEAVKRLSKLGYTMEYSASLHASLGERLERLTSRYEEVRRTLEDDIRRHNGATASLNAEIERWNSRGGAPPHVGNEIRARQGRLEAERVHLQARSKEAEAQANEINNLLAVMNDMAAMHNLDVERYRETGSRLGKEFQEGYFEYREGRKTINIYHYRSDRMLVRLLAHELGHALGLGHLDNPEAIMYWLNKSDNLEATTDDLAALKAICRIE